MKKQLREIPRISGEDAERDFWSAADSTDHIDWSKASRASFPNLKPSLKTISLRMPEAMLDRLKAMANERDVPFQSLTKVILSERNAKELVSRAKAATRSAIRR
jgi:predicted DNA binding CopG/RHH family protein